MTECTFFDDEQPTRGLPQWATITQVSEFLDVSRNAIRSAVRRAVANNEDWVKKESKEGGSTHYLIDTTHEIYQSHAQRWKENRGALEEDSFATSADWYEAREALFSPRYRKATASPSYMGMGEQDDHFDDVLLRWTKFRQRLSTWGIQIFQNVLAEEDEENPWRWRWGTLHGEGYPNKEEAIIAAIESRIGDLEEVNEDLTPDTSSLFPQSPLSAPEKPQRFKIFNKRNDAPLF
jgi:hypothetical protein